MVAGHLEEKYGIYYMDCCISNVFHSHLKLGFLRKGNIPFRIKRKGIDEQNSSIPSVLAESQGFEPQVPLGTQHFECCTIDHSDNSPPIQINWFPSDWQIKIRKIFVDSSLVVLLTTCLWYSKPEDLSIPKEIFGQIVGQIGIFRNHPTHQKVA